MEAVLEAVDLIVGEPPSPPMSLSVRSGEILGLLVPPGRPRMPLLRALAGVERPLSGAIRFPERALRVAVVGYGSLSDAFESGVDLLLVDGAADPARDAESRRFWARLAAERECGATVVVATELEDQAYRSDRVSLAMWRQDEVMRAFQALGVRMHGLAQEFLRLLEQSEGVPEAPVAARLRRLNRAAKDLVKEGRRYARNAEQVVEIQRMAADFAADSVDDRVLERLIARAQDD